MLNMHDSLLNFQFAFEKRLYKVETLNMLETINNYATKIFPFYCEFLKRSKTIKLSSITVASLYFRVVMGFSNLRESIKRKLQNAKDFITLEVNELLEIPQDILGSLQVHLYYCICKLLVNSY